LTIPGFVNKVLYFTGKFFQTRFLNTFSFGKVFQHVLRKKLELGKQLEPVMVKHVEPVHVI